MNERSVRASINPQNEQIAQANHPVQGHKKANSLMNQKMMQLLMNKDYVGSNQSNINQQALKQDHLVKSHFIEPTKSNTAQTNQKLNCQTFQVSNQYSCKGSTSFFNEHEAMHDAGEMAKHQVAQGTALKQQTPSAMKQKQMKLQGASNGGILIKDN
jgi:hypothetical protein